MMDIELPHISAGKFAQSFILRKARKAIPKYLDRLGPDNISYLLENDEDLQSYIPEYEQVAYRHMAKSYTWVGKLISDEDFVDMLPDWFKALVTKHGEQGERWLMRQIGWLRGF